METKDKSLKMVKEVVFSQVAKEELQDLQNEKGKKREKPQISFSPDGRFFCVFNKRFNKIDLY